MLRLIAAACALACVAMTTPASAQVNFQGTYKYYPYQQMAKKKAAIKRAAWKARRKAQRRAWRKARSVKARPNIFRAYRAASASRSCLTGATQAVLASLERAVGPVRIVSTCRPGAVIAGSGRPSFHRYGMAVDFHTSRKAAAIAHLRGKGVFVMTYCNMGHVHFNLGQRGYSGCGGRYASARRRR